MEPVVLVFSTNDGHAMLLGVVLCSIFENKKGDYPLHIFVIDGGILPENKKRLAELERRYGFTITYTPPDKALFASIPLDRLPIKLPIETYYRLAIGRIVPAEYKKALYIDCDTIVRGDVRELFSENLHGKTIGAVADCSQDLRQQHLRDLCARVHAPIPPAETFYFNAGVLLVDLARWREHGFEQKLFAFIHMNADKLTYHDQDALNVNFIGDDVQLNSKYNLIAERNHEYNIRDPFVVHFAGGGKPWYVLSALPYRNEYLLYIEKTPWRTMKFRKVMDIHFAKKYHIYWFAWGLWSAYKKARSYFLPC